MNQGFDLMKLMREMGKIQEKVGSQQQALAAKHYDAEAGGGMVRAKVNGLLEVVSLHTEKEAVESLGIDSIMELIVGAINEALKRAREAVKGDMMGQFQEMAGSLFKGEDEK